MTAPDPVEASPDSLADDATAVVVLDPAPIDENAAEESASGDAESPMPALSWVDESTVAARTSVATPDRSEDFEAGTALFTGARLRPAFSRPGVLTPIGILVAALGTYVGGAMMWPLHEVAPTIEAVEFAPAPAPIAELTWPAQGSAAVGVDGMTTASSTLDAAAIASVTKVVSSLMVLDRMPLAVGEEGPSFSFTRADNRAYWDYRRSDQSALDVPVGGSLTEYQLLQGTLLGSANNYIDRLAKEIWGSDREFAEAAAVWLAERGIEGITVVTPSGFDAGNLATPEALVKLGEKAMQNPVFAGIVSTTSADIPGAGTVVNTNGMLADAGVVGVKTGTLGDSWNLLTAKDVLVGDTPVRLFAAVLTQADNDQRLAETRSLFTQVEDVLQSQEPTITKGTVVGTVTTVWGTTVDVVTASDAHVVLWNGAVPRADTEFNLGERREAGDEVGAITTLGPLNSVVTPISLAEDVEGPSPWWRLTHPLDLLGLNDADR